jgi:hypothetical protein
MRAHLLRWLDLRFNRKAEKHREALLLNPLRRLSKLDLVEEGGDSGEVVAMTRIFEACRWLERGRREIVLFLFLALTDSMTVMVAAG